MHFYHFTYLALSVTVGRRRFTWRVVVGVQIGDWFIGVIRGDGE